MALRCLVTAFCGGIAAVLAVQYFYRKKDDNRREDRPAPRRFGGAIRLRKEQYERYRELHDHVWSSVLTRIYESNIRNFMIYYHEESGILFQHFEWIGHWVYPCRSLEEEQYWLDQDLKAIGKDPATKEWWKECEPCQEPFQWPDGLPPPSQGGSGNWWSPLECLCHCGHWPTTYSHQWRDSDFATLDERNEH